MLIYSLHEAATTTVLIVASASERIPEGQDAESTGRPVGGLFRVYYFGIQTAVSAQKLAPSS